jgi:hypothetical protein
MTVRQTLVCMLLAAFGCSGGGSSEPAPTASEGSEGSEVAEAPAAEPSAPESASEEEAIPMRRSGPAKLTLDAVVQGKSVPAKVRLLAADGSEAASGETGQALNVQSGEYTLEVEIVDDDALLDKPTQKRQLTVNAGDELNEKAEFPWSKVTLNVRVNGKLDRGAKVILLRDGQEVAKVKSGAPLAPISPGRYEAVVETRGAKIEVKGMLFPEGGSETMPVDVRM